MQTKSSVCVSGKSFCCCCSYTISSVSRNRGRWKRIVRLPQYTHKREYHFCGRLQHLDVHVSVEYTLKITYSVIFIFLINWFIFVHYSYDIKKKMFFLHSYYKNIQRHELRLDIFEDRVFQIQLFNTFFIYVIPNVYNTVHGCFEFWRA